MPVSFAERVKLCVEFDKQMVCIDASPGQNTRMLNTNTTRPSEARETTAISDKKREVVKGATKTMRDLPQTIIGTSMR